MPWRSRSSWNHSLMPWLSEQTCGRTSPHYATLCIYDGIRALVRKLTASWVEILSCGDLPRLNFVAIDEVTNARLAAFGSKLRQRIRHAVSCRGFSNSMSIGRSSKEESDESHHGWIRCETAVMRGELLELRGVKLWDQWMILDRSGQNEAALHCISICAIWVDFSIAIATHSCVSSIQIIQCC